MVARRVAGLEKLLDVGESEAKDQCTLQIRQPLTFYPNEGGGPESSWSENQKQTELVPWRHVRLSEIRDVAPVDCCVKR